MAVTNRGAATAMRPTTSNPPKERPAVIAHFVLASDGAVTPLRALVTGRTSRWTVRGPMTLPTVPDPSLDAPPLPGDGFEWHKALQPDELPEGRIKTVTVGRRSLASAAIFDNNAYSFGRYLLV